MTGRIGRVADRDVPVTALETRLAELRAGPLADLLPPPDGLEGRRLRRFVAQLILTEELLRAEADRLGLAAARDVPATQAADRMPPPDATGSVAAAVLATLPLAAAVYRHVTAGVHVSEHTVRDYYERNPERWRHPELRRVLHAVGDEPPSPAQLTTAGQRFACRRDELPDPLAAAVFAATPGTLVGPIRTAMGWHLCRVEASLPAYTDEFDAVRDGIRADATRLARQRYFEQWLEQRRRALVTVEPGYEHPGDPRQPDYTHHH